MVTIPAFMLGHEVTVEPYEGTGSFGPLYGPPVTAACFLDEKTRLVRSAEGSEVTSSSTVYCRPGVVDAPPESRVTLPDGRQTTVIAQYRRDGGRMPTPNHVEIQLK